MGENEAKARLMADLEAELDQVLAARKRLGKNLAETLIREPVQLVTVTIFQLTDSIDDIPLDRLQRLRRFLVDLLPLAILSLVTQAVLICCRLSSQILRIDQNT